MCPKAILKTVAIVIITVFTIFGCASMTPDRQEGGTIIGNPDQTKSVQQAEERETQTAPQKGSNCFQNEKCQHSQTRSDEKSEQQ